MKTMNNSMLYRLFFCTIIFLHFISKGGANLSIDSLHQVVANQSSEVEKYAVYKSILDSLYDTDDLDILPVANSYLDLAESYNNLEEQVFALEYLGYYYELFQSDLQTAMTYYLEAVDICKQEDLSYISSIYHGIGVAFHVTDNYKKALLYYQLAVDEAEKFNQESSQKKALINMASIHSGNGDFGEAIDLFNKAAEIRYGGDESEHYILLSNLGNLYIRQGEYQKAIPYLIQVDEYFKKTDDFKFLLMNNSYLLEVYSQLGNYQKVEEIIESTLDKMDSGNFLRSESIFFNAVAEAYEKMENYSQAYRFKNEYIQKYVQLLNKQKEESIIALEEKYQNQEKQKEIQFFQAELRRKSQLQTRFIIILSLSLALLSILGYLFYNKRNQNLLLAKKNHTINKAMKEKELLMKETHHRVKNSLQIISSMLYLQSENMDNQEAAQSVKDGQMRVKSMALIHQKLYQKDHLTGVLISEYLEDLVRDIQQSHINGSNDVSITRQIDHLILDVDTVIPIGIIINELLINALKYAFPDNIDNPQIHISVTENPEYLLLKISDNGIGLSKNYKKQKSFGTKLVDSMCKKLKANLDIQSDNGTSYTFKIKNYKVYDQ